MTATASTQSVLDALGREIPKGTTGILGDLQGVGPVELVRIDVKSNRVLVRFEVEGEVKHLARKAHRLSLFKAHGRFVKAGTATAEKVLAKRAAQA